MIHITNRAAFAQIQSFAFRMIFVFRRCYDIILRIRPGWPLHMYAMQLWSCSAVSREHQRLKLES